MAPLSTMTTPSDALTSGLDEMSQFFVISFSGVLGAPVKKTFLAYGCLKILDYS